MIEGKNGFARLFNNVFNDVRGAKDDIFLSMIGINKDAFFGIIGINKDAPIDSVEYQTAKMMCETAFNHWLYTIKGIDIFPTDTETYETYLTKENFGDWLRWRKDEQKKDRQEYWRKIEEETLQKIGKLNADGNDTEEKVPQKSKKPNKSFSDCLIHDNKDALMAKLRDIVRWKKGKDVAKVIMALEDKGCLIIPTKGLDNIRKLMSSEFGDIGSKQSISRYYRKKQPNDKPLIPQSEIQAIIDILP